LADHITIVAPKKFLEILPSSLEHRYSMEVIPHPERSSRAMDPYGIEQMAESLSSGKDALLLVDGYDFTPAQLLPGIIHNDIPIGLVQAESPAQMAPWINALSSTRSKGRSIWAVMAMWKRPYLSAGNLMEKMMLSRAQMEEIDVLSCFADMVSREDMCSLLASGLSLAVYFGHGRPEGWCGYRGIRWEHIVAEELKESCGVLVSFACDTLRQIAKIPCFGSRWIASGRACTYIGCTSQVNREANAMLAEVVGQILSKGNCQTIGQLFQMVYAHIEENELEKAREALSHYRLLGDPLHRLY
jgi:hypothetical protein